MLTDKQILELQPPTGLTDDELARWWQDALADPDGSIILGGGFDKRDPDGCAKLTDQPKRH